MGSIMKISNLSDVKPFTSGWRVEVKVLHKWISLNHESGASMDMVLADANGVKIHASCKQSLMPKFESDIAVGEWKVITNFTLRPACGFYRTTNHVLKMEFVSQTSISESNRQCQNMFLELHDFASVLNGAQDPAFLIDVLGEVLDLGCVDKVQFDRKEVTKVEFTLRDIRNQRIHCCIMGSLAFKWTQGGSKPNNGDVCLIRFAKLRNYNGEMIVTNAFDSSFVVINPQIKEAHAIKQMFHGVENCLEVNQPKNDKILYQIKRQKWSHHPFNTIQEMKRAAKGGYCRVICTVYAIDTVTGWYYFACVICNKKVFKSPIVFDELNVPNWWCEFCHRSVREVSPRFKLSLLVQDQTGESTFDLLDHAATTIVKASASKVLKVVSTEIENEDMLPPQILDIVGKTYGFGISFDENNISGGIQFNAMKVWNLNDILWKKTKSLHQSSTSSRKKQCTHGNEVENEDHGRESG